MKKLVFGAFVAVFVLLANSCTPDDDTLKVIATVDPSDIESINIYSVKNFSRLEYIDFVGESFDDYLDGVLSSRLNFAIKHLVFKVFNDNAAALDSTVARELACSVAAAKQKWGIKVINYTYSTLSYSGEPIMLSAALCVPVLKDSDTTHTLNAMSLCLPHMPYDKESCPTMDGTILMARVAFNHAVVVPDYQGRGVTSASSYSSLHTHDHAVQGIHAALAARTILKKEGYIFNDDLPLYNIGVSEGGETAYDVQKLIENDIPARQRDELNLKLTFSANGIAQHEKYITSQMDIFEYEGEESFMLQMNFYADAFDCFTEAEKQGYKREDLFSADLLDSNKKIILDHPIIKMLQEGVRRNDIKENWNPKHPITIAGSHDDNDVLFDLHAQYMYDLLKNTPDGTPNENVKLLDFTTPLSAVISDIVGPDMMISHVAADVCCFVHAIMNEDPGSAPIVTTWTAE